MRLSLVFALAFALVACDDEAEAPPAGPDGGEESARKEPLAVKPDSQSQTDEPSDPAEPDDPADPSDPANPSDPSDPTADPGDPSEPDAEPDDLPDMVAGAGATDDVKKAAARFVSWAAVHEFMTEPVVGGEVVSATEAIAFTKDNHVGVTLDGGASWSFIRHVTGEVMAVSGRPGGPFIVSGRAGYMAVSRDGKTWTDLPRFTNDDLLDVALSDAAIVAVGQRGVFVRFDGEAKTGTAGLLPDGFKPGAIAHVGGKFVAFKGNKGYGSTDGTTWLWLDALPGGATVRTKIMATSRGMCSLGRVGKGKGMACTVSGVAHGISESETLVDSKKLVAFSADGGSTWVVSNAPVAGLSGVVGNPGGPFFAFGKGLAASTDGSSWKEVSTPPKAQLRHGLVDGSTVLLVGDKGLILMSTDGGANWATVPPPVNKKFDQVAKVGGSYVVTMGKNKGIVSTDGGQTWNEVGDPAVFEQLPAKPKPGKCEGRVPAPGEICKYVRTLTSPMGLPDMRAFDFRGDVGLAMGNNGLLAFTADGGATWRARFGFPLKSLDSLEAKGGKIVVAGGGQVVVSTDGGQTYGLAQLPSAAGAIADTHIAEDGSVYACGRGGTILKASGDLLTWFKLDTGPSKVDFVFMHEVGKLVFASGSRGELYRSENKGATWWPVATGLKDPVQAMSGDARTIVGVSWTKGGKGGGNILLRSDDGGRHFYVQREISDAGRVTYLHLDDGKLQYENRVTSDYGATWTRAQDTWWEGSVPLGDGSGLRVAHSGYARGSKNRFYVVGPGEANWVIVDSFFNQGASFSCDGDSGCWMIAGGQVYRPL